MPSEPIRPTRLSDWRRSAPTPRQPSGLGTRQDSGISLHIRPGGRDRAYDRIVEGRCVSPAKGMRWRMPDGSLEPVRCGASNRCSYCAMFAALEAALVIKLDAQVRPPTVGITTTTRRPGVSPKELREAERILWRALRKGMRIGSPGRRRRADEFEAFPDLQYLGFLEWTTGEAEGSDGERRPHIHHLVKGIPSDHRMLEPKVLDSGRVTTRLEERISELWREITGDSFVVECRKLRTPAGAIAYLALHHHKRKQAPPPGFAGRRLRSSKGYYELPVRELRELASELATKSRVVSAARRAVGVLDGRVDDDELDELQKDAALTSALVAGLRSIAVSPPEVQMDLEGETSYLDERQELVERTRSALERWRAMNPPELVRVRERDELDRETGITFRRAISIVGVPEPRRRRAEGVAAA